MTEAPDIKSYISRNSRFVPFFSRVKVVVKGHRPGSAGAAVSLLTGPAFSADGSVSELEEIYIITENGTGLAERQAYVLGPFREPFFTGIIKNENSLCCRLEFNDPAWGSGRRDEADIVITGDSVHTGLNVREVGDDMYRHILSSFSEDQKLIRAFPGFLEIEERLLDNQEDDPRHLQYSLLDGLSIFGDHPYINQTLVEQMRTVSGVCGRLFCIEENAGPEPACIMLISLFREGIEELIFPEIPPLSGYTIESLEPREKNEIYVRIRYRSADKPEDSGKVRLFIGPEGFRYAETL